MEPPARAVRARGARALLGVLPNGRTLWLQVRPTPVPAGELDAVAASLDRSDGRQGRALLANAVAAKQLARAVKRDAAGLSQTRLRGDRKLRGRMLAGDAKRDRRIVNSLERIGRRAKTERKKQTALLKSRGSRDLWDQLVLVSGAPLMAAYGQRSNPLAANNLAIAIALGVWLVGDEISDLVSGERTHRGGGIRGSDLWSYLSPVANLLLGWWLLSDLQHERFVTGTTDFSDLRDFVVSDLFASGSQQQEVHAAKVDLSPYIASEHLPVFKEFADVPALATIRSASFTPDAASRNPRVELVKAWVEEEFLWVMVRASATLEAYIAHRQHLQSVLDRLQIAWAVDTQEPSP